KYDHANCIREINLLSDWFLPAVAGEDAARLGKEFTAIWERILKANPLHEDVVVLRDYHADNLLWLPEREGTDRVGLLDFQDALIGDAAYDLVSLLEDARRDVSPETVEAVLAHYIAVSGCDSGRLRKAYALLGAQRNAKIIGIFVRLGVRDGKKHYTGYLPRVWGHFLHDIQHPSLAELKAWVEANIKPEWQTAITL
ncbi:MAG: aminoglycoside phosphotransferase, partial [Alphaproteobacteria bacterium]|nr:aminoglycoside phosphotransferase [Alphaproteobacteria bacterium]